MIFSAMLLYVVFLVALMSAPSLQQAAVCQCLDSQTLKCAPCDNDMLLMGFLVYNPTFVNTNTTLNPNITTVATVTVPVNVTTLPPTTQAPFVRANFVGRWDPLTLYEQLAAELPNRGNCDSPWEAYEKKALRRKQNRNKRKQFRNNNNNNNNGRKQIIGGQYVGGGRRGPCAKSIPPLWTD